MPVSSLVSEAWACPTACPMSGSGRVSSPVVVMVMIPSYVLVVLSDEIRAGGVTALSLMLRKAIILVS